MSRSEDFPKSSSFSARAVIGGIRVAAWPMPNHPAVPFRTAPARATILLVVGRKDRHIMRRWAMSVLVQGVLLAGAAGGAGGFLARALPGGPRKRSVENAPTEAGWVVTTVMGAVAAVFALLAGDDYFKVVLLGSGANKAAPAFTVPDLVQSFAVGLIGLKWLVNFQASNTWRAVAADAARGQPNTNAAGVIAAGQPREALQAVRSP